MITDFGGEVCADINKCKTEQKSDFVSTVVIVACLVHLNDKKEKGMKG